MCNEMYLLKLSALTTNYVQPNCLLPSLRRNKWLEWITHWGHHGMGSIKCNFEKFVWYTYSLFHRHFFFVVQVGGLESLRLLKTDVTLRGNCDAYGPSYEFNYMICAGTGNNKGNVFSIWNPLRNILIMNSVQLPMWVSRAPTMKALR